MNYDSRIDLRADSRNIGYAVINKDENPFISLCFLLGIDYNDESIKVLEVIIQEGLKRYVRSNGTSISINDTIDEYLSSFPEVRKLSRRDRPSNRKVTLLNIDFITNKITNQHLGQRYKILTILFSLGLGLFPIYSDVVEMKSNYAELLGMRFIYFEPIKVKHTYIVYPIILNNFELTSSQLLYKPYYEDPGYEPITLHEYIAERITPEEQDQSTLETTAIYALYAAMGLDLLRWFFENTQDDNASKLYKDMNSKSLNHYYFAAPDIS